MTQRTKVDELREALQKQKEEPAGATHAEQLQPHSGAEGEPAALLPPDDKLLRMMADFDNYRKRMEREHATSIAFANERVLKDMMLILDHLDEALAHIPAGDDCPAAMRSFAEGVELTFRQFLQVLKKYSFEEVPADTGTAFDPSIHEAMSQIDAEGMPSNTIVHRQRRGYALHGRLLRAALVTVAK